jgi:ADP-ribose pyrophosphatase
VRGAAVWKRLASRVLLDHPRLRVREDEVELPDGQHVPYLRIESTGCTVSVLCRRTDGKILLQRQYSYPPDQVMLELPGGHVPEGEDPREGANRELMEEAGFRAGRLTLLGTFFRDNRRSDLKTLVYLAEGLTEASLPGDPEEQQIETLWVSEEEVDTMIREGQIVNLSILAAWAFYRCWSPEGPQDFTENKEDPTA